MQMGGLTTLLVLLVACATNGCLATSLALDAARGRERYSPGTRFAVDVSDAFLFPDGRVLLYGTERWSPLSSARMVEVPAPPSYEHGEGARARVAIPSNAWRWAHEPWERIVLPAPDRPDDAQPTPEDVAACSFRGALRRSSTPLRVLPPGSTLPDDESAVLLQRERIRLSGTELESAPAQMIVQWVRTGDAPDRVQRARVEVAFLEQKTSPPAPRYLTLLPLTLAYDTALSGTFVVFFSLNQLRLGIQHLTGSRHAKALAIGRTFGCQCIARYEDVFSERYLDCWKPAL